MCVTDIALINDATYFKCICQNSVTFVTGFTKTDLMGTFNILRNTDLKY